jgi:hypothetical protein
MHNHAEYNRWRRFTCVVASLNFQSAGDMSKFDDSKTKAPSAGPSREYLLGLDREAEGYFG